MEKKEKILQILLSKGFQAYVIDNDKMEVAIYYVSFLKNSERGTIESFVYQIGNKSLDDEVNIYESHLYAAK